MAYPIAKQMLEATGFEVRTNAGFGNLDLKTVQERSPKPQQKEKR
jgi:hypothetical protein